MNQITYDGKKKKEIVCEEDYKGHHIVIVSYGTHPCAYVSAGKAEAKLPKSYFDFDISCHGGVTFYSDLRHVDKKFGQQVYVGWDYAHLDDYYRCGEISFDGKKWTAEEILEEAHSVAEQLIDKYECVSQYEDIVAKSGFVFKGFKPSRRNLPKKAKIGDMYQTYVYNRRTRQKQLALMVWNGASWISYIEEELK